MGLFLPKADGVGILLPVWLSREGVCCNGVAGRAVIGDERASRFLFSFDNVSNIAAEILESAPTAPPPLRSSAVFAAEPFDFAIVGPELPDWHF